MIAAGHPLAAKAGRDILRKGGGAFLMHYAAKTGAIDAYDGRETAPKSAHAYMFLDGAGKPRERRDAGVGGLAVGVPGLLRMLEIAHKEHGRLPWRDLFQPAIKLATDGFPISKKLARQIAAAKSLAESPVAGTYFFENDGTPKAEGTVLKNLDLAETLTRIAEKGAGAFYTGDIAGAIARAVKKPHLNPGGMKTGDLKAYKAKKRAPVCLPYRQWLICGMGPPSSGGITTLQILGILQSFDLAKLGPGSAKAVHLIGEAGGLAFADRNVYIADPDFVPVPAGGLLDPNYLSLRASEISPNKAGGKRQPGMPGIAGLERYAGDESTGLSTAHLSVIDAGGNAVSLTASINRVFGSRLMARGFILNNQLTDFSFRPNKNGSPVANRAAAGKRPRSSMAPTLVFDGDGRVVMTVGSPGGTRIIGFVTKTLIAALDWKLDMQKAVDYPNFMNRNGPIEIEEGTDLVGLQGALEGMGHKVTLFSHRSGLHGIRVTKDGFEGGADSRREGVALGD
jgi:gamma-glutamyltranspeptidase/glutathione hydrolase